MNKIVLIFLLFLGCQLFGQEYDSLLSKLAVGFDGKHGQVEIGSNFIGAEFHHSRPLPSRISFYYPVANSIDMSTDYWMRDESQPFLIHLNFDGQIEEISSEPWTYRYTPFYATFEKTNSSYFISITYHFCKDFPAMVVEIRIKNLEEKQSKVELSTILNTSLRTCHTYAVRDEAKIYSLKNGSVVLTEFDKPDTDSTLIFVANVSELPINQKGNAPKSNLVENPLVSFQYQKVLKPKGELITTQLIGSCRAKEGNALIEKLMVKWHENYILYEQSILGKVLKTASFELLGNHGGEENGAFLQTFQWSKAMLESNKHYLDGNIIPMPCPAEYNFFFTHDLLLTDLGAVFFDKQRVKDDLLYLKSLTKSDSVLPHAYYWKDGQYQTELCGSDNWNHLWFIILAGSYLKHTADKETVAKLLPIIKKSMKMQLKNKGSDDLMYAMRPDWWDIGDVYGARSYITSLMIRSLREYVYIYYQLREDVNELSAYLSLANRMKDALQVHLWDEESGYLLNMFDDKMMDRHFYAGSLIAATLKILDAEKTTAMLETTRKELLDRQIGIRIVMPADFDQLIDRYKFHGMEMGKPYQYINGGIWPQGIVWYALGWLAINRSDSTEKILKKYYTLEGIRNSPNGQPSFFEYRNADARSANYGKVDKPTFLWAGGWFLYSLYHLAGLRENEWNISFDSNLPKDWDDIEYETLINGSLTPVSYKGSGKYFKKIEVDGANSASAVLNAHIKNISLERGIPEIPYLADATCFIRDIKYDQEKSVLSIEVGGLIDQSIELKIISPLKPEIGKAEDRGNFAVEEDNGVWIIDYSQTLFNGKEIIQIKF